MVINLKPLAGRIRAMWEVVRQFAPYAVVELVLPGGTVLAILYWALSKETGRYSGASRYRRLTSQSAWAAPLKHLRAATSAAARN